MLGFGFSIGAQVLIARRNGAQEYKRIGPVFLQGTFFLLLLASLLFTASHLYSPFFLRKLIGSDDVYQATMKYVDWRVYGFFFCIVAVVMVLANVMLNYVLIFGKFGFPALGIAGAAIASSISEAVSVLFFILYTWKKVDYKKYGLFEYSGIDFRMLRQILGVSIWIMIQHGIAFLGWFVFFVVMEHQGERPLAITNVVRSISSFLFMFVNAFASTSSSLVSNLIGAGKPEQVMGLCGRMIRICYYFVLPLGILIALFPELVLRIYTDNLDLIAGSVSSLWVMLSSYLIAVPAFIFFFSVSGTGNTQTALLIDRASIFVYVLYALWVGIRMHADVAVCWTTEHVYDLMILSAFFYLWKGNWQNKKL